MATFTASVQGLYVIPIPLSANLTNITLTGALDAQQIVIEFQQNATGGWTVASSSFSGLQQPTATPNTNSFQLFIWNAGTSAWQALGGSGTAGVSSINTQTGALTFTGTGITISNTGGAFNFANLNTPWIDVQSFGAIPKNFSISQETTTTTGGSGGTVDLTAAKNFVTGGGVMLSQAGAACSISTGAPSAPTGVANCVTGAQTILYKLIAADHLGGLTASGPSLSITNAPTIFNNLPVNIATITASSSVVTVTTSTPINALTGQTVHIVGAAGAAATWNGTWVVATGGASSFTYALTGATGTGTPSTGTSRISNVQQISAITRNSAGVITITTAQPHNFVASPGSQNPAVVIIDSVTPQDLTGEYVIATASGSTITCSSGNLNNAVTGGTTLGTSTATCFEYIYLTCPAYLTNTVAYYVYSDSPAPGGGTLSLVGKTMPGEMGWKDWGPWFGSGYAAPVYVPTSVPAGSSSTTQNQMWAGKITAGGGTTTLTVSGTTPFAATPPNLGSGQLVQHDDAVGFNAAIASATSVSNYNGTLFLSPPQTPVSFPQYIFNSPVQLAQNVSTLIGCYLVVNEPFVTVGKNSLSTPFGTVRSASPQFAVGPVSVITGLADPLVYCVFGSFTMENLNLLNHGNGQIGFLATNCLGIAVRNCFFSATGNSNNSTSQPVVLNSSGIVSFDTCQWAGNNVIGTVQLAGNAALWPAIGNLVCHWSDQTTNGCAQISVFGNSSFNGRGILLDGLNYSTDQSSQYVFGATGAIEYQSPCTPSLMVWGPHIQGVYMGNWENDSARGSIVANWSNNFLYGVTIDNCGTSTGQIVTGGLIEALEPRNTQTPTTTGANIGQNFGLVSRVLPTTVTTTGSSSDVVTLHGVQAGSIAIFQGNNAAALADIAAGNVSAVCTLATVTLTHGTTSGMVFNIFVTGGF